MVIPPEVVIPRAVRLVVIASGGLAPSEKIHAGMLEHVSRGFCRFLRHVFGKCSLFQIWEIEMLEYVWEQFPHIPKNTSRSFSNK